MGKGRLEAFSDGVIAVIITIMVNAGEKLSGHAAATSCKGMISVLTCFAAIPLAFFSVPLADAMFVLVALMWFIPDRRIEQALGI